MLESICYQTINLRKIVNASSHLFVHLFRHSVVFLVYLICAKSSTGPRNTIMKKKSDLPFIHGTFSLVESIYINHIIVQSNKMHL